MFIEGELKFTFFPQDDFTAYDLISKIPELHKGVDIYTMKDGTVLVTIKLYGTPTDTLPEKLAKAFQELYSERRN